MSIQIMAWAFKQDLSPTHKIVLLALANYAGDTGVCWPKQETIARDASMSVRSVRSKVADLEAAGYLSRTIRPGTGEGRQPDAYVIHCPWCEVAEGQAADSAGSPDTTAAEGQAADSAGRGNRKDTPRQPERHAEATGKLLPLIEPSEPSEEPSDSLSARETTTTTVAAIRDRERLLARTRGVPQPIPHGWSPSEHHGPLAAQRGLDVRLEGHKFIAWARAQDGRAVDWDSRFDQWLLAARVTEPPRQAGPPGRHSPPGRQTSGVMPADRAAAAMAAMLGTPQGAIGR